MAQKRSVTQLGLSINDDSVSASLITQHHDARLCFRTQRVDCLTQGQLPALVKLRKTLDYQRQPTIVGIAYPDVMTKQIRVDAQLNDRELMLYLTTQAERLFNYCAQSIHLDYDVIDTDEKYQYLRVIVARKKKIKQLHRLVESAGFKMKAIDVDAFALCRGLALFSFDKSQYVGIVFLRKNSLLLCISQSTSLCYATQADYGENQYLTPRILPALHRALQFFSSAHPDKVISEILLYGECSSESLAQSIASTTGVVTHIPEVNIPGVFSSVRSTETAENNTDLLSSGLALWGLTL